jgi:hypothetical protein
MASKGLHDLDFRWITDVSVRIIDDEMEKAVLLVLLIK